MDITDQNNEMVAKEFISVNPEWLFLFRHLWDRLVTNNIVSLDKHVYELLTCPYFLLHEHPSQVSPMLCENLYSNADVNTQYTIADSSSAVWKFTQLVNVLFSMGPCTTKWTHVRLNTKNEKRLHSSLAIFETAGVCVTFLLLLHGLAPQHFINRDIHIVGD